MRGPLFYMPGYVIQQDKTTTMKVEDSRRKLATSFLTRLVQEFNHMSDSLRSYYSMSFFRLTR